MGCKLSLNCLKAILDLRVFGPCLWALIAVMLLTACGESTTQVVQEKMPVVASVDDLSECSDENEGEQALVKESGTMFACVDGEWVGVLDQERDTVYLDGNVEKIYVGKDYFCTIETFSDGSGYKVVCNGDSIGAVLNGRDGVDGINGEDGRNGVDGADGADGKDGRDGVDGKDGTDGQDGADGAEGVKGDTGEKGADGKNGMNGSSCDLTEHTNGEILITCGENVIRIFKAACGPNSYNPETQFCDERDHHVYRFVMVGDETWMAENLSFEYRVDGEVFENYCYQDDCDSDSSKMFGRYYTWYAAMKSCPVGWHLPDTLEWNVLFKIMGMNIHAMQVRGHAAWPKATDAYGFSAIPAGTYYRGVFYLVSDDANFWSSTQSNNTQAYLWNLLPDTYSFHGWSKSTGYSVRCIKNVQ